MTLLHTTVTITGGLAFTGPYDDRLPVRTCADVVRDGTGQSGGTGGAMFNVPILRRIPAAIPDRSAVATPFRLMLRLGLIALPAHTPAQA